MAFPALAGRGWGEVLWNSGPKETTKESKSFLRHPGSLLASLRGAGRAEAGGSPTVWCSPVALYLARCCDLTHCNTSSWQRSGDFPEHFPKDTAPAWTEARRNPHKRRQGSIWLLFADSGPGRIPHTLSCSSHIADAPQVHTAAAGEYTCG